MPQNPFLKSPVPINLIFVFTKTGLLDKAQMNMRAASDITYISE